MNDQISIIKKEIKRKDGRYNISSNFIERKNGFISSVKYYNHQSDIDSFIKNSIILEPEK